MGTSKPWKKLNTNLTFGKLLEEYFNVYKKYSFFDFLLNGPDIKKYIKENINIFPELDLSDLWGVNYFKCTKFSYKKLGDRIPEQLILNCIGNGSTKIILQFIPDRLITQPFYYPIEALTDGCIMISQDFDLKCDYFRYPETQRC